MWRCSLNSLPTGENLRKRGLLGHTLCARCGAEETLEHILFLCAPATVVWDLCPWTVPLDPLTCSSFRNTLEVSFTKVNLPPIGTSANIFAWICWINRNQFTFESKQTTPRDILSNAISSTLMAEALAARAALDHALSLNFTIIWLISDCKRLIQAITTNQRSVELFGGTS
ncbi:hypothetical protein F2Q70_00028102 [Brassica cretica]|uniref:Reverse transcriptase zinc-binding domain-containing protein n=1 Tax=Brassica cretica TaxID=69181 RepID=A0A8S9LEY8_BRACR|nr:hypothetical protein F2Q70_00028102 [Brassica cretica]